MNKLLSRHRLLVLLLCLLQVFDGLAQQKRDSTKTPIQNGKVAQEIIESITKRPSADTLFNLPSEDAFLPYKGKIIRRIDIEHLGFERSFYNGTKKVRRAIVNIGNSLHSDTKERVIRNNLFISENKPLNPYKVADNERYLRDLEFILDARIDVTPVAGTDSVDLVVTTRDVFSLGGSLRPRSATEYTFRVYDANLLGQGQRLQFNGLVEESRNPVFGSEIFYTRNSVGGSLANLSVGYTSLNTGSSYGDEYESAYYLRISRPLVSPYTRMVGGLEWSHNWSSNVNGYPDTLFLNYRYNVYDLWTGYNIGVHNNYENRSRHLVSMRWFHQDFRKRPGKEVFNLDPLYNDVSYLLGEVTFFKQNFYKTRYIYGFGRTEDVPYGHSAYVTVGWAKQLNLERPYLGMGISKKVVNRAGDFYEADIHGATHWRSGEVEDATMVLAFSWFSHLMERKHLKIRQYIKGSYAMLVNRTTSQLLSINNEFGVRGFTTDSLRGESRLGFTTETVFFTNWRLFGFRFAPITFADVAFLSTDNKDVFYDKPYWGIGAGLRTRNENLIFGTIELRFTYFPRIEEELSHFKVTLSSNLRVKYTGTFVQPPRFIRPNQSDL